MIHRLIATKRQFALITSALDGLLMMLRNSLAIRFNLPRCGKAQFQRRGSVAVHGSCQTNRLEGRNQCGALQVEHVSTNVGWHWLQPVCPPWSACRRQRETICCQHAVRTRVTVDGPASHCCAEPTGELPWAQALGMPRGCPSAIPLRLCRRSLAASGPAEFMGRPRCKAHRRSSGPSNSGGLRTMAERSTATATGMTTGLSRSRCASDNRYPSLAMICSTPRTDASSYTIPQAHG